MKRVLPWVGPPFGLLLGFSAGYLSDQPGPPTIESTRVRSEREAAPINTGTRVREPIAKPIVSIVANRSVKPRRGEFSREDFYTTLRIPSVMHRRHALKSLFDRLSPAEFPRVLTALEGYPGAPDSQTIPLLFRSWILVAPEEAIRRAGSLSDTLLSRDVVAASMRAWARKDVRAARQFAETLPMGPRFETISYIESLIQLQAPAVPPAERLAQVLTESNPLTRMTKLPELFSEWAKSNPAEAAAAALSLPNDQFRETLLPDIVRRWTKQDAPAVAKWMENLPSEIDRAPLQRGYATSLAAIDPPAAEAVAVQLPASDSRTNLLVSIASQWFRRDPEAAISMATRHASGADLLAFEPFYRQWSQTEPERAVRAFFAQNPSTESLQASSARNQPLVAWVMDAWVKSDPKAAGDFAVALGPVERREALSGLVSQWCTRDAGAAGDWAKSLPSGDGKKEALQQVASTWAAHDALRVTPWLDSLPPGEEKQSAIDGFALTIFDTDPDGALSWIRNGNDEEVALEHLKIVWGWWSGRNGIAARKWLQESTALSESERRILTENAQSQ